jgi:hypothetical protein
MFPRRALPGVACLALAAVAALWPSTSIVRVTTTVVLASTEPPQANKTVAPPASLVQRVCENLLNDDLVDQLYTFRLHRRSYDVSVLGKVSNGPERVFEVHPSPDDPEKSYRRLIAENGRPLSPDQARRTDERLQRERLEAKKEREHESADDRARRERERTNEEREQRERLDDALRVFAIETVGYEEVDGRRLLVATLTPRPTARTATPEGRQMKEFQGRAWVDEQAAQLVRVEMQAIDDVTIGLGIIGRIHKGSRGMYRRAPLPDGTWAPLEARFVGAGRSLLFRPFQIETWAKYSEYRRVVDGHTASPGSR